MAKSMKEIEAAMKAASAKWHHVWRKCGMPAGVASMAAWPVALINVEEASMKAYRNGVNVMKA
jgi:hypothetical protein